MNKANLKCLELPCVGTRVAFRRSHEYLWEPGIVDKQSRNSKTNRLMLHIKPADENWNQLKDEKTVALRFTPASTDLMLIATPAELRRADPRGRLRRFLKANKLVAVRVLEKTATPIYRILEPTRNFVEVIVGVLETKTLPFRFSAGSFYNAMVPSKQERTVHLVTDGTWNKKVYTKPPGFEP